MAALKETFSYDIINKKTGNVFARLRYQDLKNDIQLKISKLNNDELISLIMFNISFLSKEDLIKCFTNVLNKNIGDNIIIAEDIDVVFNQEPFICTSLKGLCLVHSLSDAIVDGLLACLQVCCKLADTDPFFVIVHRRYLLSCLVLDEILV